MFPPLLVGVDPTRHDTYWSYFELNHAESWLDCATLTAPGRHVASKGAAPVLSRVSVAACVAAVSIVTGSAAPASADAHIADVSIKYQLLIAGAEAAVLDLDAKLSEASYRVSGSGKTTGLIDLFARMRFSGSSHGKVAKRSLRPAEHNHNFSERGKRRDVKLTFDRSGKPKVKAVPEFDPSLSRIPLEEKHLTGTIDPASVFVVPVVASGPLSRQQCERTVSVIDGQIRFDMTLSHLKSEQAGKLAGSNYRGPVLRCNARVRPIGGHRKKGFLADLANQRGIEVWLAPTADNRYLIPLRVTLPTPIGQAELRMRKLTVAPAVRRASLGQ